MNDAKEYLLTKVRRGIYNSPTLGASNLQVKDGDDDREIVFELVDTNKYTLRDEFIHEFEEEYQGRTYKIVIETFTSTLVTAVFVDTSLFEDTVQKFLTEFRQYRRPLTDYNTLSLRHVEALEQWGAVGRIQQLDSKHIHDAFIEYHRKSEYLEPDEEPLL